MFSALSYLQVHNLQNSYFAFFFIAYDFYMAESVFCWFSTACRILILMFLHYMWLAHCWIVLLSLLYCLWCFIIKCCFCSLYMDCYFHQVEPWCCWCFYNVRFGTCHVFLDCICLMKVASKFKLLWKWGNRRISRILWKFQTKWTSRHDELTDRIWSKGIDCSEKISAFLYTTLAKLYP